MTSALESFLGAREAERERIGSERRVRLDSIAAWMRGRFASGLPVRLVFVCTHNSRRSHMAHVWSAVAARRRALDVACYSGGTEATAFEPRAAQALARAGLRIEPGPAAPVGVQQALRVHLDPAGAPVECFSKRFDASPNPSQGFAAVMVCSAADAACPTVPGADARFSLPFEDPGRADGTEREARAYDECARDICREMLELMARVREPAPDGPGDARPA